MMQANISRYILILVLVVSIQGGLAQGHHGWGGRGRGRAMRSPAGASVGSAACQTCKQPQQHSALPAIINHIVVNGDGRTDRVANDLASQALANHGQNGQTNHHASPGTRGVYGDKLSGIAGALGQARPGGGGFGGTSTSGLGGLVGAGAQLAGLGAAGSGGGLAALAAGGAAKALSARLGGGAGGHGSGRALIGGLVRKLANGGAHGGAHGGHGGGLGALGAAALEAALAKRRNGGGGHSGGTSDHLVNLLPGGHNGHQQAGGHSGGHGSQAHLLPKHSGGLSHHGQGHQHSGEHMYGPSGHYAEHQHQQGRHGAAGHGVAGHPHDGGSGLHHHESGHNSRGSSHGGHAERESYGALAPGHYPRGEFENEYNGHGHDTPAILHGGLQYGLEGHGGHNSAAGHYGHDVRHNGRGGGGGAHGAGGHYMPHNGMYQAEARPAHHQVNHSPQEYNHHRGHEHGHERGYENAYESGRGHSTGYEQGHGSGRTSGAGHAIPAGHGGEHKPYGPRRDQIPTGGHYETQLEADDQGDYELVDEYGAPVPIESQERFGQYGKHASEMAGAIGGHGARLGARGAHGQPGHIEPRVQGHHPEAGGLHGRNAPLDPSRLERLGGTYMKGLGLNGKPARGGGHGSLGYEAASRYGNQQRDSDRYHPSGGKACGQCDQCPACKLPARAPANYRIMEPAEDDYSASAAASSSAA